MIIFCALYFIVIWIFLLIGSWIVTKYLHSSDKMFLDSKSFFFIMAHKATKSCTYLYLLYCKCRVGYVTWRKVFKEKIFSSSTGIRILILLPTMTSSHCFHEKKLLEIQCEVKVPFPDWSNIFFFWRSCGTCMPIVYCTMMTLLSSRSTNFEIRVSM